MDPLSRAEGTFWAVWYYVSGAVSRFLRPDSSNAVSDDPSQESEHDSEGFSECEDAVRGADDETENSARQRESDQQQTLLSAEFETSQTSLTTQPESVDAGPLLSDSKRMKQDVTVKDQTVSKDSGRKDPEKNEPETSEVSPACDDKLVEQNFQCHKINWEVKESQFTLCSDTLSHSDDDDDDETLIPESNVEKTNEKVAHQKEDEICLEVNKEELNIETSRTGLNLLAVTQQVDDSQSAVLKSNVDFNGNSSGVDARKSDPYPDVLLKVDKVKEADKEGNLENAHMIMAIPVIPEGEPGQEVVPELDNTPTGLLEGHLIESQELNATTYEGTLPANNNESGLNENTTQWFLEAGDDSKEIQLPEEVENHQNSSNIRSECLFAEDMIHGAVPTFDRSCGGSMHATIIPSEILDGPKKMTTTHELITKESEGIEHVLETFEKANKTEEEDDDDDEFPSIKSGDLSLQDDMTGYLVEVQPGCMIMNVVGFQSAGTELEGINWVHSQECAEDGGSEMFMETAGLLSPREVEPLTNAEPPTNLTPEDPSDTPELNNWLLKDTEDTYCAVENGTPHSASTICAETCAAMLKNKVWTDEEIEDLWSSAALSEEPDSEMCPRIMQSIEEMCEIQIEEPTASISGAEGSSMSESCLQHFEVKETTGSVDAPEISSQREEDEYGIETPLEVDGVALDFVAQKSRISVKNRNVRPPTDPRSLINKPSVTSSVEGRDTAMRGKALKIKLPGLGVGLQGFHTDKRTVTDDDDDDDDASVTLSQGTVNEDHDSRKGSHYTPRWMPPAQPRFGNPLMSELKSKLKKTDE